MPSLSRKEGNDVAYQLPFGGLSAVLALTIRIGKWIGGGMTVLGAMLLTVVARLRPKTD